MVASQCCSKQRSASTFSEFAQRLRCWHADPGRSVGCALGVVLKVVGPRSSPSTVSAVKFVLGVLEKGQV